MLVSEIGYLSSVSKSMYGVSSAKVQNNKAQNNKSNLIEGFGNVEFPKAQESSAFANWLNSMQSMFRPAKNNDSNNVLSLIG